MLLYMTAELGGRWRMLAWQEVAGKPAHLLQSMLCLCSSPPLCLCPPPPPPPAPAFPVASERCHQCCCGLAWPPS